MVSLVTDNNLLQGKHAVKYASLSHQEESATPPAQSHRSAPYGQTAQSTLIPAYAPPTLFSEPSTGQNHTSARAV